MNEAAALRATAAVNEADAPRATAALRATAAVNEADAPRATAAKAADENDG
jgi:hypothetical protein